MILRLRYLKLSRTPLPIPLFSSCPNKTLNPKPFSSYGDSSGAGEWTEEIEYLDESGAVLSSGPGARPAAPGLDSHVLSGAVRRPSPPAPPRASPPSPSATAGDPPSTSSSTPSHSPRPLPPLPLPLLPPISLPTLSPPSPSSAGRVANPGSSPPTPPSTP
ncbi:Pentatricopeptide repeat-containing protein, mitochondrial [Ananas comosus]|uniref:Pentatricopeptide repeat-containing protein, mitochondrial n=1 Tax=Ananas comosus TaxID=4615 RepID=A0A199UJ95_ANACO|nr:Pentatricopeptide repeat-containing protein, mitochondrial [Ananas comosus]